MSKENCVICECERCGDKTVSPIARFCENCAYGVPLKIIKIEELKGGQNGNKTGKIESRNCKTKK